MPDNEFRFDIQDFTPTTLPMKRLNDYIAALVELFGYEDKVHFIRVDEGSAVPCIYPDDEIAVKLSRKMLGIQNGHHISIKSARAKERLNELLAEDETSAFLKAPTFGIVIEFPGARAPKDRVIGPLTQPTQIQGELFMIGGRDNSIQMQFKCGKRIHVGTASREAGRSWSQHLFKQVRAHGSGSWLRSEYGKWKLLSFEINRIEELKSDSISHAVAELRKLSVATEKDSQPLDYVSILTSDE